MNRGKICISVCAETADALIEQIRRAEPLADVIEVRFDGLSRAEFDPGDPEASERTLKKIFEHRTETPWISTFRSQAQGGQRDATFRERNAFWKSGFATEYCDLEEDMIAVGDGGNFDTSICSYHDLAGVPADLDALYERLRSVGADIIKIAYAAEDITDTIPVWRLLERSNAEDQKVIPIAMGDAGKLTRILGLAHGAFLTYASLDTGGETAPGQVTANDLTDIFRAKSLDRETRVFGVLGDPIAQSLSPYMHNPAFAASGMNAVFTSLLVKDVGDFMRRMVRAETREIELNFGGFSVTMPHKQAIMPYLDAIDPTAAAIGAVNTVKIDGRKLTGYNTDAHGFITPLKARFGDLRSANVAVVGAGGAARAVVYALKQEHADVTVFARDVRKADILADEFGVRAAEISNFRSQISDNSDQNSKIAGQRSKLSSLFDILVDTTPLGMTGPRENDALFNAEQLAGLKFVYDLVTKPVDTPILREAKLAGIETLGGIEMLVAQGVRQFEIWTGGDAPAEVMRTAALARMKQLQK